jgi:hypothetical protein
MRRKGDRNDRTRRGIDKDKLGIIKNRSSLHFQIYEVTWFMCKLSIGLSCIYTERKPTLSHIYSNTHPNPTVLFIKSVIFSLSVHCIKAK